MQCSSAVLLVPQSIVNHNFARGQHGFAVVPLDSMAPAALVIARSSIRFPDTRLTQGGKTKQRQIKH
jgi:hypothetical protein